MWSSDEKARAERIANEMLQGVGIEDRQRADYGLTVLHVRRQTTPAEQDKVFETPRGRLVALLHEKGDR